MAGGWCRSLFFPLMLAYAAGRCSALTLNYLNHWNSNKQNYYFFRYELRQKSCRLLFRGWRKCFHILHTIFEENFTNVLIREISPNSTVEMGPM